MSVINSCCVSQQRINGLYAITPDEANTAELLRKVRLALQGGAQVLQYRNKPAGSALRQEQASALRMLCDKFPVLYIINDDVALASRVGADGVHLGSGDGSIAAARTALGERKLIGVSCYNRLELAQQAAREGADYVAFGAFFASSVKPDAPVATLELLRQARAKLMLPLVAIGGITQQNGRQLAEAGADALAVISALFNAADIEGAARELSKMNFK